MKLLFFGTPEMAVPFLRSCAEGHRVAAVVTQPDKPAGRGLALRPPPVKTFAQSRGIEVFQPPSPSAIAGRLRELEADAGVVVAYGKLLKADVLASTRLGLLNIHFSLLPKYRGAAPIAWALMQGEHRSGVTLFWLDEGMDTGPIQDQRELEIEEADDAISLATKLGSLGVRCLEENLASFDSGIRRRPQQGEPSLAPKLTREHARVSFRMPAVAFHNRVRGLRAGPCAFLGAGLSVRKTLPESPEQEGEPGRVLRVEKNKGILIQCQPGTLWIVEVQPQGKKPIPAADFLNGLRLKPGHILPD